VVANSPATLTEAPEPNTTPLGLMIHTWPLAESVPLITELLLDNTRFSAMA
jgi:hypothetical protein